MFRYSAIGFAALWFHAQSAKAQEVPWHFFTHSSGVECGIIGGEFTPYVVLSDTLQLARISFYMEQALETVPHSEVRLDTGEVFIKEVRYGHIDFFDVGFNAPTLWWVSDAGFLYAATFYDSEGDFIDIFETTYRPGATIDFVTCDPCDLLFTWTPCLCHDDAECHDHSICSDDFCLDGFCRYEPNSVPCDDGNMCTENDVCSDFFCDGTGISCVSDDPCISAGCHEDIGCYFEPIVCDDENECTDDVCLEGECVYTPNRNPCVDYNACTAPDYCENSECVGGPFTAECIQQGEEFLQRYGGLCGAGLAGMMPLVLVGLLTVRSRRKLYA